MIYLYCAYYACASYLFVSLFVICASYSLLSFIYFICCSTMYSSCCLISFLINSLLFHCSLFKREKNNSDPELCSGISIPLTVQYHQYESLNIIQQTPPTLSQYRSEGPITIIDIAEQTKPISPHRQTQQRARQLQSMYRLLVNFQVSFMSYSGDLKSPLQVIVRILNLLCMPTAAAQNNFNSFAHTKTETETILPQNVGSISIKNQDQKILCCDPLKGYLWPPYASGS